MDARTLERLARKHLLPRMPGFEVKGNLLFAIPIGLLLRGLHFESSGFARDLRRIRYFVMPLYTSSATHINFSFARILGGANGGTGDRWWEFPADDREDVMRGILRLVERDALPWLDRVREPRALADRAARLRERADDPYTRECVAYSRILVGDLDEARAELRVLREAIAIAGSRPGWLIQMDEDAAGIEARLQRDPEEAQRQLLDWRDAAIRDLRLERFAAPTTGAMASWTR